MRSCWIFIICPLCISLNSPSTSALDWSLDSLYSSVKNIENKMVDSLLKGRWRPKRAAGAATQDYTVDIEISFPNSSLMEPLKKFLKELNIPGAFNSSDGVNITSITVTTACSLNATVVRCSCEDGYYWPLNTCSNKPTCSRSPKQCDCINTFPLEGTHCQTTPAVPPVSFNVQLTINEMFTEDLYNSSSTRYINLKMALETAFYNNYKDLPGFVSVYVTAFRKGSTIAEYVIIADPLSKMNLQIANANVTRELSSNFTFPPQPFQTSVYDATNCTTSQDILFVGDTLKMTCRTISNSTSVVWTKNSSIITTVFQTSLTNGVSESVLTIENIAVSDAGEYACTLNDSSIMYIGKINISVFSVTKTFRPTMDILCNGSIIEIYRWCINKDFSNFKCSCTADGPILINALETGNASSGCRIFSITADMEACRPDWSGTATKYTCSCSMINPVSALKEDITTLTFIRKANVTIDGPRLISEQDTLQLTCTSTPAHDIMTWQFENKAGTTKLTNELQQFCSSGNKTLTIPKAISYWEGKYTCTVFQKSITSSNSTDIAIISLPLTSQIETDPVVGSFLCDTEVALKCCVSGGMYDLQLKVKDASDALNRSTNASCLSKKYLYTCDSKNTTIECIVSNQLEKNVIKEITLIRIPAGTSPACKDPFGNDGDPLSKPCPDPLKGVVTYTCKKPAWIMITNSCISEVINTFVTLSLQLQSKPVEEIPTFLASLNSTVTTDPNVISNFASISAIVGVLETLSNIAVNITTRFNGSTMQSFLETANVIVQKEDTWGNQSEETRISTGSRLLKSTEDFSKRLTIENGNISKVTDTIKLKGILVESGNENYSLNFDFPNATATVSIPSDTLRTFLNSSVITIAYSTLKDILTDKKNRTVNGLVLSTILSNQKDNIKNVNISMDFQKIDSSLTNATCVFWNFSKAGAGEWDSEGCMAIDKNDTIVCRCDHLTSFSMLMSSSPVHTEGNQSENSLTKDQMIILEHITYIGVGISMGSLVICIIIEMLVWKSVTKNKTSYMRHVCLVNIAVSLLIADIWFIIGANLEAQMPNVTNANATATTLDACDAATFFIHLFYLSLFFWMLTMGLILFYRMIYVFHDMSRTTMLAIAFSLGYGCPLIISCVTVAATRTQGYYREGEHCWLNIHGSMALLGFVVPALTIVAINFVILAVVIITLLRPSIGDKPKKEDKGTLVKLAKSIAILTPMLGLTWGFGVGLLMTNDFGLHVVFALLNSLQGFFILLFGCLTDVKIREALLRQFNLSKWASQITKSTSSSTTRTPPTARSKPKARFFGKRAAYNVSTAQQSSSREETSNSYSTLD
ncbi:adhesion G protein-coupled receptor F5-like [Ambystoma mexicanum]|uniref:adhesion G protein-coupled receptor F5-like n=1 Tax=Ambystoma mexicanum TaxID=8296 RepID=UPI0037E87C05